MKITGRVADTARTATSVSACLAVALYVYTASEVRVTTQETLGVDRLAHTAADGFVAERYGGLLPPGTTTLRLDEGVYHFRAVANVQLALTKDSLVTVVETNGSKTTWPDPPSAPAPWSDKAAQWDTHSVALNGAGSCGPEPTPTLLVTRGDALG